MDHTFADSGQRTHGADEQAIERVPANDEFKDEARIMQRQFRESIQDMEIVLKRLRATEQAEPN